MPTFDDSLREAESYFTDQLGRRDKVLKDSRDVISACSRSIIAVHNSRPKEAQTELAKAKSLLLALKKSGGGQLGRYIVSPEAEFVEASAVSALWKGRPVPARESLGASPEAYLLGLLDTVGELKRLVLDSIMRGDLPKARRFFRTMQDIYSSCSPLAAYDHVVNGARRKIDVARMLVEDTRSVMTEESRRESVASSMARLEKRLARRRG